MKKNQPLRMCIVALMLTSVWGTASTHADTVYATLPASGEVDEFSTNGVPSIFAKDPGNGSVLSWPVGVAFDSAGNLYVANNAGGGNGNGSIEKFTTNGVASVFAADPGDGSVLSGPEGIAFDTAGNLYVANDGGWIEKFTTNGTPSVFASDPGDGSVLNSPFGLAFDSSGNLYAANTFGGDNGNGSIEKFTTNGTPSVFASDPGDGSVLNGPAGLAFDASGTLYVANYNGGVDYYGSIEKFTTNGTASVFVSDPGNGSAVNSPLGVAFDSAGNLYVANFYGNTIKVFDKTGKGSLFANNVSGPAGLVIQRSAPNFLFITNLTVMPRPYSAIISWTTGTNATTQVQYGITPALGSSSVLDTNLTTNHAVLLTGLTTKTVYYFQVTSTLSNNTAVATGSFSTDVSLVVQALQATYSGVWTLDTAATDKYSTPYKYASTTTGSGSADAFFRPAIATPGLYDVYIWYSEGANRSTNVPILISYQDGYLETSVNQTLPGGSWQLLAASQYFAAGTNSFVRIGNGTGESNRVVIADAVEWVYSASQDSATNGTIPSWWTDFFFGTNNVNSSASGSNGYSLLANYVIGLTPTNPNSLVNLGISRIPHGFQAMFSPWQAGRTYGLESATTIRNPTWTAVPNLTSSVNTNGQGVIINTNVSGAQKFYRLSIQMSP